MLILVLVKDNKSALSSETNHKCITYYNEIVYVHILYRFFKLELCAQACFKHLWCRNTGSMTKYDNFNSKHINILSKKRNALVKLITLKCLNLFWFQSKFLTFTKRTDRLLMALTCQCSLIPGMCHFVFPAAFVRSVGGTCHEVTNEGIDLGVGTSVESHSGSTWTAANRLGLLVRAH